ncbi:hypothetical protein GGI43DRAFT_379615 [Trichoderma evansii]
MEHTNQDQTPQRLPTVDNPAIFPVRLVASKASKNDDVSLIVEALSLASKPESRNTVQDVFRSGLRNSLKRSALKVLSYLLDHGADISIIDPSWVVNDEDPLVKPSLEALEMLIAHGWDINAREDAEAWPLLWYLVEYPDLVTWCLDQGAIVVYPPSDDPSRDANRLGHYWSQSLLEHAAKRASVATFRLLREKGAPFHQRILHGAVERAVTSAPPFHGSTSPSTSPSTSNVWFNERMAMIRYLVDEAGLDVNSEEWRLGKYGATPLDIVSSYKNGKDARELIWFLLDRGADLNHVSILKDPTRGDIRHPNPLEEARLISNTRFLEAVQEWQDRQRNNTTCEIL